MHTNVKVGDILLIMDENLPRGDWPMGIVTSVSKGRDDLVRSVRLRSKGKDIMRPISKLVFLEGSTTNDC